MGPHMAVDGNFPNRFLYASQSTGIWTTVNGLSGISATVSQISTSTIPVNDSVHNGCVIIDANSGTNGSGYSNKNYVSVHGSGLYVSQDGGTTWALVSGSSTDIMRMWLATDGRVYFLDGASAASGTNLFMLSWSGSTPTITNITAGITLGTGSLQNAVPNPSNANQLVVFSTNGQTQFQVGTWGGSSWSWATKNTTTPTYDSSAVPWHAMWWTNGYQLNYMAKADPNSGAILMSNYQSIVTSTFPFAAAGTAQHYVDTSLGIEEVVCNSICIPPGGSGAIIVGGDDVGVITVTSPPNTPPSSSYQSGSALSPCHWLEYASTATNVIFGTFGGFPAGNGQLTVSTNYGGTWNQITTPSSSDGGTIAATSSQNIIWRDTSGDTWRSTNGATSWTQISTGTIPTSGIYGPAADRVTDGTFYFLQEAATPLLLVTTDTGVTWNSFAITGGPTWLTGGWGAVIRAVPGNTGHPIRESVWGSRLSTQSVLLIRIIFNGSTAVAQSTSIENSFDLASGWKQQARATPRFIQLDGGQAEHRWESSDPLTQPHLLWGLSSN